MGKKKRIVHALVAKSKHQNESYKIRILFCKPETYTEPQRKMKNLLLNVDYRHIGSYYFYLFIFLVRQHRRTVTDFLYINLYSFHFG